MLLSVCKNNLVVCVRGHARSCAGAARWAGVCVWRAAPASWRQTHTPAGCSGELRRPQGLTHLTSSITRGSSYTRTPLPVPEVTGHPDAPCRTDLYATESSHRRGHRRTCISISSVSDGSSCVGVGVKFQPRGVEGSNVLLGVRLSAPWPGTPRGARGLSSGPPGEPPAGGTTGEEGKETHASRVPGQGLFKFKELYENPWTVPNLLCVCRILLAPVLGFLITDQQFHLCLGLFALAGFTDLLDGYIARTWPNQKSALGSALDPLADKILISVLYISLTYAHIIPAPLTALVIFRDVGLIAAVFYVRYKTVPPPVTLSRFFNPCYATAQLKPTLFSKVNTAIQLFLVAASLASPVFHYTDSVFLQALWYITAVTTAASGYSYYHYGKKTVQVLNSTK